MYSPDKFSSPIILPLADSYFKEISRNLSNWQLNQTSIYLLAFVFCSIALIAIIAYLLNIYNKTNNEKESFFELNNKNEIVSILSRAWEDRSKFELSLTQDSSAASICSLYDLNDNIITLELPSQVSPVADWTGKTAYIFFSIPLQNKQRMFYFFQSNILDQKDRFNYYLVMLQFPEKIEQKQKRKHLRLEPNLGQVQVAIWDYSQLEKKIDYIEQFKFKPPALKTRDKNNPGELNLVNISGTGLRLKISHSIKKKFSFLQERQELLFLEIFLNETEEQNVFPLYLQAKTKNISEDFFNKDLEIGIEFSHQARFDYENPEQQQWIKIDSENGVEAISNWVFKQHLKIYREKGLT